MISILAGHLTFLDQLLENCRQPTSEQARAEVVQLCQPVRVGREQQLAKRDQLQGLPDQCLDERAGVVYGQSDIDENMAEYLRQVRGVAVERVVVQQEHRNP